MRYNSHADEDCANARDQSECLRPGYVQRGHGYIYLVGT